MAHKALGPATLQIAQAVAAAVGQRRHPLIVACSGGADSLALAAGAVHVGRRLDLAVSGVIVDHGLQDDSAEVAAAAAAQAGKLGLRSEVVTIEVEGHRFFTRDGDDVRVDLPISLAEAVRGGPVKVPTVDKPVMLTVPAGSSSGKVLRLKGKGFHRKGGERGDQLVTLMIALPADDPALRQFVDGWTPAEGNPRAAMGV